MNRKIIGEEIKRLIETIDEQARAINNYEGVPPLIEIDIVMDNVKRLYMCFKELEKGGQKRVNEEISAAAAVSSVNEDVAVNEVLDEVVSVAETVPEVKEAESNIIIEKETGSAAEENTAPVKEEVIYTPKEGVTEIQYEALENAEKKDEKTAPDLFGMNEPQPMETPKTQPETQKKKTKSSQSQGIDLFAESNTKSTLADKFRDDKKSLNEIMADKVEHETIGSKMQKTPIRDLKTAIKINEKFLFINSLFEGNMQEYNFCIETLNHMKNSQEAAAFMGAMKVKYGWDDSSEESLQLLMEMVNRRFMES